MASNVDYLVVYQKLNTSSECNYETAVNLVGSRVLMQLYS